MEFVHISDTKIKVILDGADMSRYALSCEDMNYDTVEGRRVVWEILDEVKQRTGFDAGAGRVCIQVYPSRTGGCELYVTKLGADARMPRGGYRAVGEGAVRGFYRFPDLATLLAACGALQGQGYDGKSAAYADAEGGYYLSLAFPEPPAARGGLHPYSFVEEYGRAVEGKERRAYICEYATPIADAGAVEKLAALN